MAIYQERRKTTEAYEWTGSLNPQTDPAWITKSIVDGAAYVQDGKFIIRTPEETNPSMVTYLGDYVVRGDNNNHYPVSKSKFEILWEPSPP